MHLVHFGLALQLGKLYLTYTMQNKNNATTTNAAANTTYSRLALLGSVFSPIRRLAIMRARNAAAFAPIRALRAARAVAATGEANALANAYHARSATRKRISYTISGGAHCAGGF